ncbi:hypothetical protein [Archangium sp.]|jgi:hypothetical protein|uniref:hypothetical protein n=1 Tax=Archangium sp. TaxID=1872627 RepID=UPI002EDAD073
MTVCVVTEEQFDGELIESLLKAKGLEQARVFVGGNRSSAESLASSLMVVKQLPVALVLDAEAHDPSKIQSRRRQLEALVGAITSMEEWKLILMAPELEILFFRVPGLLESLGLPAPSSEQLKIAEYVPGKVLEELVTSGSAKRARNTPWRQWLMKRFSRLPHDEIWKLEPFAELQRFLIQVEQASESAALGDP